MPVVSGATCRLGALCLASGLAFSAMADPAKPEQVEAPRAADDTSPADEPFILYATPPREARPVNSTPIAPLTGKAIIHEPENLQTVDETFRIRATLPADWFDEGAARGQIFYYDVRASRFVIVSEFSVPAQAGQNMRSSKDKAVDFELTAPPTNGRLVSLELLQAAPPEGFRPYGISTFIEIGTGPKAAGPE